jgi:hypothetical protein
MWPCCRLLHARKSCTSSQCSFVSDSEHVFDMTLQCSFRQDLEGGWAGEWCKVIVNTTWCWQLDRALWAQLDQVHWLPSHAIFQSQIKISEWTSATMTWFHLQQCGHMFNGWLWQLWCICSTQRRQLYVLWTAVSKGGLRCSRWNTTNVPWDCHSISKAIAVLVLRVNISAEKTMRMVNDSMISLGGSGSIRKDDATCLPCDPGYFSSVSGKSTFLGLLWLWVQTKHHITITTKRYVLIIINQINQTMSQACQLEAPLRG